MDIKLVIWRLRRAFGDLETGGFGGEWEAGLESENTSSIPGEDGEFFILEISAKAAFPGG